MLAVDLTQRTELLDVGFDSLTVDQLVTEALAMIGRGERGWLCTVNVAILMMMRSNPELNQFVRDASFVVADGQPLIWVAPWFGGYLPERITGVDLVEKLARAASRENIPIYLLGAKQEVVEGVDKRLRRDVPGLNVAGVADGYFDDDTAPDRARQVRASGARILFVALGVPLQERFLREQWNELGVDFAIGVGGSFDVLSGERMRAPKLLQKLGLEWAFRLVQEPRRLFLRYLVTTLQFAYHIARQLIFGTRTRRS